MIVYDDFDDSAMIAMSEHRRLVAEAVAAERARCAKLANAMYDMQETAWPKMVELLRKIEEGGEASD